MSVQVATIATVEVPTFVEFSDLETRVDNLESQTPVPGPQGDSAYQVAVNNGFVGTQQEWLDSLVGEPGLDGADGATGPMGPQGSTGPQGPAGPGLPVGGTLHQIPRKKSAADFDIEWVTPSGGATTTPRPVFLQVASSESPADFKSGADYVCTGSNDQLMVNLASERAAPLASRNSAMPLAAQQLGKIVMGAGRYNCSNSIGLYTGVHLQGMGALTEIRAIAMAAVGLIELVQANDHLVYVSDVLLNGNYSAGGSCHGIDFDMSGGTGTTGYPSSSPDSYHNVHRVMVDGFKTNGIIRHGIRMWASTTTNNRGNIIDNCQIRNISGDGIHLSAASDSFVSACHIGTVVGNGIRVATGNTKITGGKTFYCDTNGVYITSGRGTLTGFESQDDATGIYVDAPQWAMAGITVDTSLNAGIRIGSGQIALNGFNIFNRASARYATQTNGLHIDAAHTDLNIMGNVVPDRITNKVVGTPGARSFMRVSDGTQLVSAG